MTGSLLKKRQEEGLLSQRDKKRDFLVKRSLSLSLLLTQELYLGQHLLTLGSSAYEQSCLRVETMKDFWLFICGHPRCLPFLQLRFSYLLSLSSPFSPPSLFLPMCPLSSAAGEPTGTCDAGIFSFINACIPSQCNQSQLEKQ